MNILDDYTAYGKLTSGLKISRKTTVNEFILIKKISSIATKYYNANPELVEQMLPRSRYASEDVLYRFIGKLNKFSNDNLQKILTMFDTSVLKTIRLIEKHDTKKLIKKKILK